MAVQAVNIVIEQGTDFERTFALKLDTGSPLNLSKYTLAAGMKKWSYAANSISFGTTYNADPSLGRLTISMGSSVTGIITEGRYNYDVVITNTTNDKKTKVITGQVTVNSTIA